MSPSPSLPLPAAHALRKLGRDLALARRKRGIATADMAARLFVSRDTLWRMERGDPSVALGTLATAAFVLQLHDRLANLAAPATDALALSLDERRLPKRIRRTHSMSVEIHIEWKGKTYLVGHLHTAERSATVSFEYSAEWLGRADAFAIDRTSLPLRAGPHHSAALFGALQDCGPDRWGRMLIERAVRKHVLDRKPYQDLDYVLALADASRIGALRFRVEADGPFLAAAGGKIPPVVQLAALLNAANAVHGETETAQDLRYLLGQGSPLGGARPKSAVVLADGQLAIAKFPKPDDVRDIAAGEILALTLARQAGIEVPGHQLLDVKGKGVSIITRFDRDGVQRIPFLSAHSLLGLAPGEPGAYTLLADGIRQFGHDTAADLLELWRRLVFSLLASNYDDHLRNHGFLMREPGRWALSPAYDLNPVPEIDRPRMPRTPITEEQEEPTIGAALAAAPRFGLKAAAAKVILREVLAAVAGWRKTGRQLRLKAQALAAYATAFDHPLMDEARRLV